MIATHATPVGTARYRDRYPSLPGHFRRAQSLWLSSIGIGTYLGQPTLQSDSDYSAAVKRALTSGINVVDTASNYRFQRSERAIGQALTELLEAWTIARDEIVVCTKGGYIPFDSEYPRDPNRYIRETVIEAGLAAAEDIVDGHCLAPRFIRSQLEQSIRNLGVSHLDVYYIHNPESQLESIGRTEFRDRLRRAFAVLEEAVETGLITHYGTATWNGYRVPPGATEYLSLEDVLSLARDVSGLSHHCRFVQLPYNLAMLEAVTARNQRAADEMMSILEAAERFGVTVMGSASLLQGRLLGQLPDGLRDQFEGLTTDAQRGLQFARSTPGITTALCGMGRARHVAENLALAQYAPLTAEQFKLLFA
ncbi:MAG: aldo/keto reductase [Chloroflexi bacterium]|nr:aldo/keto reductase [Chloroflexota bacterium]